MYYEIRKVSGERVCRARLADTFVSRAIGLMFRADLPEGEGLLIKLPDYAKRGTIHSFFMRFPIDLFFIGAELQVLESTTLKPWRWYTPHNPCDYVLEVRAGSVNLRPGDRVELVPL
ncbi:DUF192 domain-containing protein [Candidatus Pyrohabitans sp.]